MKADKKKEYESPHLTVVTVKTETGYAESRGLSSLLTLGNAWENFGGNAWDGSSGNSGTLLGGGWVDEGGNPWS